jgi:hypothetical protein
VLKGAAELLGLFVERALGRRRDVVLHTAELERQALTHLSAASAAA